MSRSGYSDDLYDDWAVIRWRGAVASAIKGRRGQAFLRELVTALDALPAPRLVAEALNDGTGVCAIGSVGRQRRLPLADLDPDDYASLARVFGISEALVREIEFINDDVWGKGTPEQRFQRIRAWVLRHLVGREEGV